MPRLRLFFPFCLVFLFHLVCPNSTFGEESIPEWPPLTALTLTRGEFDVRLYPSPGGDPRALVIFGSGDGGWSEWEHTLCVWLQAANLAVAGFDFSKYSATDFDQPTLAADMAETAGFAAKRLNAEGLPVLYGGWSMGAVHAIAASSGSNRPAALTGLLLLSLDSRGRYGIRAADMVGMTPTGPGTFDLNEFNPAVTNLRVVQYHGTADFMAKTSWIRLLKSPHQLYLLQGMNHGFDGLVPEFKPVLLQGVDWALGDDSAAAPESLSAGGFRPFRIALYIVFLALLLAAVFSRRIALKVLPAAVALCGAASILETFFPREPQLIAKMEAWIPLETSQHGQFILLFSGMLLLLLARGLHRRKRVAWHAVALILTISALLNFTQTFEWNRSAMALILLIILFCHRKLFLAGSDAPSFRIGAEIAAGAFILLLAYGTVSLHVFGSRGFFGDPLSWAEAFRGAGLTVLQIKTDLDELAGREAAHFLTTIRLQGLGVGFLALIMALRPVVLRRHTHTREDFEQVKRLVALHTEDPMCVFALLPDKHYYFEPGIDGVVAYALWRDMAVVLADPICEPDFRRKLIEGFVRFCQTCDWKPVFYCLHSSHRELYEQAGFQLLRIAEEARLDLLNFSLDGKKFQNLRTARNKALKNGLQFGWLDGGECPRDFALEKQLEAVSKEWLGRKHGGEMGFDLSPFSLESIRETGATWVKNPDGRLEAFATWHTYANGRGRCLDIMRSRSETKDVMDFLILESMERFKAQGCEEISFGGAPLANLSDPSGHSRQDRIIRFVFEKFDRFYGYKRLFFFKQKYHPKWKPRYLAYPRGTSLALVGMAIARVHLPLGFRSLFRS